MTGKLGSGQNIVHAAVGAVGQSILRLRAKGGRAAYPANDIEVPAAAMLRGTLLFSPSRLAALLAIATALPGGFGLAGVAHAATFTVDTTADNAALIACVAAVPGDCSLRGAVIAANTAPGDDIITLPAGTYNLTATGADENAATTGDLDVTQAARLTINGAGAATTIIDGQAADRVFEVLASANLELAGVTVRNGRGTDGADGSGVAGGVGGIAVNGGTLTLTNSTLSGNAGGAGGDGGAAAGGAGGIALNGGTLTLTNSTLSSNAGGAGGRGPGGGGTGGVGFAGGDGGAGGIAVSSGTVTLTGSTLSGNRGGEGGQGGGGGVGGNGGKGGLGGFGGNGGMAVSGGTVTLTDSTLSGNPGGQGGSGGTGGSGSGRDGDGGDGGTGGAGGLGLSNGTVIITNNTLSDNSGGAGGGGGAVPFRVDQPAVFGQSGDGAPGGVRVSGGTVRLTHTTVSGNTGATGATAATGGIALINGGAATLRNTIVAANAGAERTRARDDVSGAFTSEGGNLIGDASPSNGFTGPGDKTGTRDAPLDPQLGPLADNGGPTLTRALLTGSRAIDAALPTASVPTDQRGAKRPFDFFAVANTSGGQGADIGAFELQGTPAEEGLPVPSAPDLQAASDSGASSIDNITSDTSPTFDITTAEATATVRLLRDGAIVATRTGPGAITDPGPVADGTYTYTSQQTNGTRPSSESTPLAVTIDATAPAPIADTYSTDEDTPLTANAPGVLGNDTGASTAELVTGPANAASFTLNADGSFSYTPNANFNGGDSFTYRIATDTAGNTSSNATVSITVNAINDAPLLDNTGSTSLSTIREDQTANSGNLVSEIIASAGGDRITDVDAGSLEGIAVTAVDNGNGTWQYSTDNGANWAPFGNPSQTAARLLAADGATRIRFVPNLNFTDSVDPGLIFRAWDRITGSNGSVADASANGGATAFSTATETARITVRGINDAPSFTRGADQTVNEDAGAQSVSGWATNISPGPADESDQVVSFAATNNNNPLFSTQPAVDSNGALTYTPAPNANGTATVSVTAVDDGGTTSGGQNSSAPQSFTITINAVNDAPSFMKGADQTVSNDAGAQTVSGWATNITSGPPNESAQTLSFTVTNNNNALFSAQPAIDSAGTLTYTPNGNSTGSAVVSVRLTDNGGTANGGEESSGIQSFTITVTSQEPSPTPTASASATASPGPSASPTPTPPVVQTLNLSTRGNVQTGENVLISGIIVEGPDASTKRIIMRALGPSLTVSQVPTALRDPLLELYDGSGVPLFENDNWRDTQQAEIEATKLQPSNERESAIVMSLLPGSYTAVMSGADGGTGVGLAEIYDLNRESQAKVQNISTRGFVGTNNNVLIGGFILDGSGTTDVLIRAIGPSMADDGVANTLQNPTLRMTDANGNETFNDNWRSSQQSEISATTIAPEDDREAAILATLPAGTYTAIVAGAEGTSGVALVEIYSLGSRSSVAR